MNQKFEQLKPYLENWAALQAALQLFGWDMENSGSGGSREAHLSRIRRAERPPARRNSEAGDKGHRP